VQLTYVQSSLIPEGRVSRLCLFFFCFIQVTVSAINFLPSSQKAVSRSAGYAVFSNFGTKIFVAGGGSVKGIVIDNKTEKGIHVYKFLNKANSAARKV
jgi:hypothetical protein